MSAASGLCREKKEDLQSQVVFECLRVELSFVRFQVLIKDKVDDNETTVVKH